MVNKQDSCRCRSRPHGPSCLAASWPSTSTWAPIQDFVSKSFQEQQWLPTATASHKA